MKSVPERASVRRPNLSRAVRLLIRDAARRLPELSHVQAERVLVVAGEARRASRATVRPLRFDGGHRSGPGRRRKPRVTFRGRDILYIVTLRPLFFRASTPDQRVETILHELFHLSLRFDGTLAQDRRHRVLAGGGFEKELRPLVRRYLASCPEELLLPLRKNGEVLVRQWLEKPPRVTGPASRIRKRYTEAHTFLGPVRMITRATRH